MSPPKLRAIACQIGPSHDARVALSTLLLLALAGCGGTIGASGNANPEAGTIVDAGPDGPSPRDCAIAVEGASCDSDGEICRGPCDPCATCGFLACSGGHWSPGSDFPPSSCFDDAATNGTDANASDANASDAAAGDANVPTTIPCGPSPDGGTRLCAAPAQYCEESGGGPPPPPDAGPFISYACVSVPAACTATPTCACLTSTAKNSLCGGSGDAVVGCTGSDAGATVSCGFP
jgi:hypothetical protein